jgi:hypothetical protein
MPSPRRLNSIIRLDLDDQTLLLSESAPDVHCLNPVAALIWDACDGATTEIMMAEDLARRIAAGDFAADYATDEAEDLVAASIAQFAALGLLETPARLDRRALMIKAARAAAFTALVSSTILPLAAEATFRLHGCERYSMQQRRPVL